jgi:hypothetical protein
MICFHVVTVFVSASDESTFIGLMSLLKCLVTGM